MNPVIVIPAFITANRRRSEIKGIVSNYDYSFTLNDESNLDRCLASLESVKDVGLIIIPVVADKSIDLEAVEKVRKVAATHPSLNIVVVGSNELSIVRERMEELNIEQVSSQICLRGYGAMRNLSLVIANAMGFDAVIFLDENDIVDDPDFMEKALYGLGRLTKQGIPILAKTGYYINDKGSYYSKWEDKWYNRFWKQGGAFNAWIGQAINGPRLSRSNHVCGSCLVVHKEAFRRLAFDPWIPRGEDLDYLLNMRMYGSEIWFDNQWKVRRLPPKSKHEGARFRQDIFRWLYEYMKLEYSHSLIDLQKITAKSLEPYPGPFLQKGLRNRIVVTAILRSFGRPDKRAYREAAREAMGEATKYAQDNCANYFEFQQIWPQIMERLASDSALTTSLVQSTLIEA